MLGSLPPYPRVPSREVPLLEKLPGFIFLLPVSPLFTFVSFCLRQPRNRLKYSLIGSFGCLRM